MDRTGWRQWIGFGVFGIAVVGLALLAAGWFVSTVFFASCRC